MTAIYTRLHKRDPMRRQYRYYVLAVQSHLFGGWSLIREWGRIGQPGHLKIELCDNLEAASGTYCTKLRQKRRRGYS
jgi:predicted DNA-binding WGR domain protein